MAKRMFNRRRKKKLEIIKERKKRNAKTPSYSYMR